MLNIWNSCDPTWNQFCFHVDYSIWQIWSYFLRLLSICQRSMKTIMNTDLLSSIIFFESIKMRVREFIVGYFRIKTYTGQYNANQLHTFHSTFSTTIVVMAFDNLLIHTHPIEKWFIHCRDMRYALWIHRSILIISTLLF